MGAKIPYQQSNNGDLSKEAFPGKNDQVNDGTDGPDPVNEGAFKLMDAPDYKTPKFG